ncbi:MAG TPA: hypothetical protein VFO39_20865 [Candidatus Sulfotelmatobacter sp.]|nr:hypothetical protein [Candidatus Sulfotelmatobacter sp.]
MTRSDEPPLLDRMMHPLAAFLEYVLGCQHRHLSRVFTLRGRTYKVCCDCGARFDYSLRTMSIVHRRDALRRLLALRRLRARHN